MITDRVTRKRALLAIAHGWTQTDNYRYHDGSGWEDPSMMWKPPGLPEGAIIGSSPWPAGIEPPDYFNDLNAVENAARCRSTEERIKFAQCLAKVRAVGHGVEAMAENAHELILATASEKADALGAALSLWEIGDSDPELATVDCPHCAGDLDKHSEFCPTQSFIENEK